MVYRLQYIVHTMQLKIHYINKRSEWYTTHTHTSNVHAFTRPIANINKQNFCPVDNMQFLLSDLKKYIPVAMNKKISHRIFV